MAGPTDLEQVLLEYINDARLDPMGNAARYLSSYSPLTSPNADIQSAISFFGVNGTALLNQFSALTPVAPLAWNENLAVASRQHSSAMIAADQQSHQLNGEPSFDVRDSNAGYTGYSTLGENIFAFATSDLHAHAGFMVDWGIGGIQSPPGHRNAIMSASFREVGIGIVTDGNPGTDVGPLVVTQDFGARFSTGVIILGAAYNDSDHDNFYSVGEGLGNLSVSVGASSVTSWASGGFSLILGVTGAQIVNLSGAGLTGTVSATVTVSSTSNIMFEVVDGNTLQTSSSVSVTGTVDTLKGLGATGLMLTGGANVRAITGTKGNDTMTSGSGNNTITGGLGNDTINGGGGTDSAVYSENSATYTITHNTNGSYTVAGADGTDTLTGIESLVFANRTLTLGGKARNDFNSDGDADLLWQNDNGQGGIWLMNGSTPVSLGAAGPNPGAAWHIKGAGDFNGDGKADMLWQNDNGQAGVWMMNGTTLADPQGVNAYPGTAWHVKAAGDFDGNGKADILWQHDTGQGGIWLMDGATVVNGLTAGANPGPSWQIMGSGDFNSDGKADILFQHTSGQVSIWEMNGGTPLVQAGVGANPGPSWRVAGSGDFDGDGRSDILLQHSSGQVSIWLMNGVTPVSQAGVGANPGADWVVKGAADLNGDGQSDVILQNNNGQALGWMMAGTTILSQQLLGPNPGPSWHLIAGASG